MKKTRAHERHESLSRRQVLRGLGACVALPTLLSASPAFAKAMAKKAAPARMAFVYIPNGAIPAAWWPAGEGGADFALSPTLAPLANVRNQIQVISGLTDVSAEPGADGAGDHARAGGTFLTGVRIKKTAGSDIKAGVSIDQVVANQIGHQTRFASLELTCDVVRKSGECDSGYACAYEYNLAWRSSNQPLAPEPNPRFVFERLFGSGSPHERVANLKRRQVEQHSILDYVLDDARGVSRGLDGRDREKLDQYLTSVREIEQRICGVSRRVLDRQAGDACLRCERDVGGNVGRRDGKTALLPRVCFSAAAPEHGSEAHGDKSHCGGPCQHPRSEAGEVHVTRLSLSLCMAVRRQRPPGRP